LPTPNLNYKTSVYPINYRIKYTWKKIWGIFRCMDIIIKYCI
jgi:hypothetical protein